MALNLFNLQRLTPFVQGGYYVLTGLWGVVELDSFQAVTGPKSDLWLVRTVGLMIVVVGAVLAEAAVKRRITPEIVLLGVGSALGLACIDIVYATLGRISLIYYLDAIAEILILMGWWRGRQQARQAAGA